MKPATHISDLSHGGMALPPLVDRAARTSTETAVTAPIAPSLLRDFYELTKPRMNFLVVITTAVGFYAATAKAAHLNWVLLIHAVLGTALTAAGASVLNQYVERDLDGKMPRTANRPLPTGRISEISALLLGVILGAAGVLYLTAFVNPLTALLGAVTLGSYVWIYTPMKRWTSLCTIVGAVPGAIPPMMGFTALHNAISPESLALFGILFLWQMPHFLAIAIMYKDDYAAGGFKMLPCVDPDLSATGRQIVVYSLSLLPMTLMPFGLRMAGLGYLVAALVLGIVFLAYGIGVARNPSRENARKLFFMSIIYLPLLLGALMVDKI
jgi:protoheme IX farnesyltransferase